MAEKVKIDGLRKRGWLLFLLVAGALLFAVHNRFVQDDAFISFRYAQNLARGNSLVWNIGERVEGYTNFLWVVLMTPAFWLSADPVTYSYVLSLASFLITLVLGYKLASVIWVDKRAGVVTVFLLGVNFSFSSYATGGLETQFGIALILSVIWMVYQFNKRRSFAWSFVAGLITACSIMTRMDSALIILPFLLLLLCEVWEGRDRGNMARLFVYGLSVAIPLIVWMACRKGYYGDWVPNTFHIKTQGSSYIRGIYYQVLFYTVYGLFIPVAVCLAQAKLLFHACAERRVALCLLLGFGLWSLYLVKVGGGFMEFRLVMPAYALLVPLLSGLWCIAKLGVRTKTVLLSILFFLSLLHAAIQYPYPCIQTIKELRKFTGEWSEVACVLNQIFGDEKESVKIGVTCAGIIPYYTGMETLDLLGLNDADVARDGDNIRPANSWIGNRPGHVRMATWSQVVEKQVNVLINTPWIFDGSKHDISSITRDDVLRFWYWDKGFDASRVSAAMVHYPYNERGQELLPEVIAWPMSNNRYLMTVYVCHNPIVDAAIKRCGAAVIATTEWSQQEVKRSGRAAGG